MRMTGLPRVVLLLCLLGSYAATDVQSEEATPQEASTQASSASIPSAAAPAATASAPWTTASAAIQAQVAGSAATRPTAPASAPSTPSAHWTQLSAAQQQSLHPLASTWDSLSDRHRRKWIALAQNFKNLTAQEQATLHSRMADWAALTPRERELARLNFAETKKLATPDRASNWEAYKALSAEQRQRLIDLAPNKPGGAAIPVKPAPPGKLAAIPVTRHTPLEEKLHYLEKGVIDRNTLLPKRLKASAAEPTASAPQKSTAANQ